MLSYNFLLLLSKIYSRLCFFLPLRIHVGDKIDIFLDNRFSVTCFEDVFASRAYYLAIELFKTPPRNVLDLGACEGFFALLVEAHMRQRFPGAKVGYTLYEANPYLIRRIKRNLSFANLYKGAHIYCGAVGKRSGSVIFGIYKNYGCSSIHGLNSAERCINIPYLDIEKNLTQDGLNIPQLIKVDIEGCELDFFENYTELLSKTCVVAVEFHNYATTPDRWQGAIKKAGLLLYDITAQTDYNHTEILINRPNLDDYNLHGAR